MMIAACPLVGRIADRFDSVLRVESVRARLRIIPVVLLRFEHIVEGSGIGLFYSLRIQWRYLNLAFLDSIIFVFW